MCLAPLADFSSDIWHAHFIDWLLNDAKGPPERLLYDDSFNDNGELLQKEPANRALTQCACRVTRK